MKNARKFSQKVKWYALWSSNYFPLPPQKWKFIAQCQVTIFICPKQNKSLSLHYGPETLHLPLFSSDQVKTFPDMSRPVNPPGTGWDLGQS